MHDSRNVPAGGAEGNIGGAERQYSGCERAVPGLNIAGVKEGDYSSSRRNRLWKQSVALPFLKFKNIAKYAISIK